MSMFVTIFDYTNVYSSKRIENNLYLEYIVSFGLVHLQRTSGWSMWKLLNSFSYLFSQQKKWSPNMRTCLPKFAIVYDTVTDQP